MIYLTRREFGANLLGAMAALRLTRRDARADTPRESVFGGIQVGVQSYTFRKFTIERMIAAMSSIGLTSIELWDGHLDPMKTDEAGFKAVRRQFDKAGIKVNAYCVNFPLNASDEYLDRGFKGALLLGADVMTASVQKSLVPRLDQWCQKYQIKLGLHNHWLGDSWFHGDKSVEFESPTDFLTALQGRSKYMSINLDIGHFSAAGYDPVAFIKEHHDRIVTLHVKDRGRDPQHINMPFGQGGTPVMAVLNLLKQLKFPYAANLEYEDHPEDPTPMIRDAFEYSKAVLMK